MGARILVVEDTAFSMQFLVYLLTEYDHTVLEAVTGEQAIEVASATAPDLVLMDLQLPGIDGFETMTALRAIPGRAALPVIAVTSFAMVGDRDRALQAGFDHYLTKPIDPETFVEEINARLPAELRGQRRPACQPGRARAAEPAGTHQHSGADILVLDDTAINRTLLRSILEPHGYRVRTTATVDEAIAAVDGDRPDLVVSDVHVRQQSGVGLLSHLRAVPSLAAVPFIFLSATTDWQDPVLADGRVPLLRSPIEPSVLLAEVEALLQARRSD
jgi:CheY-like chemotaxis protein